MSHSKPLKCVNIRPDSFESTEWKDDMREWPSVFYGNIYNYLVHSRAVDGDDMENFKSLESFNYFQSGSVGRIVHVNLEDDFVLLKSEVRPSQRANQEYHLPWVLCKRNGRIQTGECTCVAGKSKTCSHVGALLWKIEYAVKMNMTGKSCTDDQMKWNKGTTRNIEPRSIISMDFKKPKRNNDESEFDSESEEMEEDMDKSEFRMFTSHNEYKVFVETSDMKDLFMLENTTIYKSLTATPHKELSLSPHGVHSFDEYRCSCDKCFEFYKQYIQLTETQINSLNQSTTAQASSHVWKDSRKVRITGSTAHKVPVRDTTNPDSFIREQMYPSFLGNTYTKHGNIGEIKAKTLLRENGMNISDSGTVVSQKDPWLSVSPDGIIHTDMGNYLLEIKCPVLSSVYDSLESYFCSGKYDVVGINDTNQLKQRGSRGYYLQVQLTLHVCNLQNCKLVVWTPEEYQVIDVSYDVEFCSKEISRLRRFYFHKFLPRIVDDFESSRFQFTAEYKTICCK